MALQTTGKVAKYLYEDVQSRRERERQSLINAVGSDTYNLSLYRNNNIIIPQNNISINYNDNRQYNVNSTSVNWKTVATTVFICLTLYLLLTSRHEIAAAISENVLPAITSIPRVACSGVVWLYSGMSGGIRIGLRAFAAVLSFVWTCFIVSGSYICKGLILAWLATRNVSRIVYTSARTAGQTIYGGFLALCHFVYAFRLRS